MSLADRSIGLLALASICAAQSGTLTLTPAGGCVNGLGRVRVSWSTDIAANIRILAGEENAPLTGIEPPYGSTETGDWVKEGMRFLLVDAERGRVLASANAVLDCEGTALLRPTLEALGWIPLQLGNRWVYRTDSRVVTSSYLTRTVVRIERIDGVVWYMLDNPETFLRADARGVIYQLQNGREAVYLDPSGTDSSAVLRVTSRTSDASTPFGGFPGSLGYSMTGGLRLENGLFVRGLGLFRYSANILAGSSGGFADGAELVEARIAGRLLFRQPGASVTLAAEKRMLDVTARTVTNCAVPCYFAACGLVPGVDPPDTYKPCFQTRVGIEQAPPDSSIELTILDSSGVVVHSVTLPITNPGDFLRYQQLPLYSAPNRPFATGFYKVRARMLELGGSERASAVTGIEIR